MANQPHSSRKAVTWRLGGALVDRVKTAAEERGETVLAFVTRALERELDQTEDAEPPTVLEIELRSRETVLRQHQVRLAWNEYRQAISELQANGSSYTDAHREAFMNLDERSRELITG